MCALLKLSLQLFALIRCEQPGVLLGNDPP